MRVLTLGTFDLFHSGHVNLLRRCRDIAGAGVVTVGLNTDEFVARFKGRPPVINYEDRRAVVEACCHVDEVLPNAQANGTAFDVIALAHPNVIVVGSDWQNRDYCGQLGVSQEWFDDHGIRIMFVPYTAGISTTDIRRRMDHSGHFRMDTTCPECLQRHFR